MRSDLVLVGFAPGIDASKQQRMLQEVLGVDEERATYLMGSTPCILLESVPEDVVYEALDALEARGAELLVRANSGGLRTKELREEPPETESLEATPMSGGVRDLDEAVVEEPAPQVRPGAVPYGRGRRANGGGAPRPPKQKTGRTLPMASMQARRSVSGVASLTFFGSMMDSFLLPLRGRGLSWIFMTTFIMMLSAFVAIGSVFIPIFGRFMIIAVYASIITLNAKFFFATFVATVEGESEAGPLPRLGYMMSELVMPGLVLLAWSVTAFLPLMLWMFAFPKAIAESSMIVAMVSAGKMPVKMLFTGKVIAAWGPLVVLMLAPFAFWPISLVQMTSGSMSRMWNVFASLQSIAKAPLKYVIILVLAVVSMILPVILSGILVSIAGRGIFVGLVGFLLSMVPTAYSHGVMGAMMGALVSEHPDMLPEEALA